MHVQMMKRYADIDLLACKSKFKSLRKGYEAMLWCEMHQEKAASEGSGRFRGETYAEFFDRQTGLPPRLRNVCIFTERCSQAQGVEEHEQDGNAVRAIH